jgi:hypothetical protein
MKRFRGTIIFILVVGAWAAAEWLMHRRTVPPTWVTNFSTFAQWQRSPRDIEVIRHDGADYLLATGPGGGLLPSGPSGYVFDCSGRLVDWSSDIGDSSRFQDKWLPTSQRPGPHLDVERALQWLRDSAQAGR